MADRTSSEAHPLAVPVYLEATRVTRVKVTRLVEHKADLEEPRACLDHPLEVPLALELLGRVLEATHQYRFASNPREELALVQEKLIGIFYGF